MLTSDRTLIVNLRDYKWKIPIGKKRGESGNFCGGTMAKDDDKLDAPRRALLKAAEETGATLKGLSEFLGRNPSYLHTYVYRGSPRKLDGDDRRRLAEALGVADEQLGEPAAPPVRSFWKQLLKGPADQPNILELMKDLDRLPELYRRKVETLEAELAEQRKELRRLQLLGDRYKAFTDEESPDPAIFRSLPLRSWTLPETQAVAPERWDGVGFVDRHPLLVDVFSAYAISVWHRFMEPVFKKDHIAWVYPGAPIHPGNDVVVVAPADVLPIAGASLTGRGTMIMVLQAITDREIVLTDYATRQILTIPNSKDVVLDLIIGELRVYPIEGTES